MRHHPLQIDIGSIFDSNAYMGSFGGHDKGVQLEALLFFTERIKIENHQQGQHVWVWRRCQNLSHAKKRAQKLVLQQLSSRSKRLQTCARPFIIKIQKKTMVEQPGKWCAKPLVPKTLNKDPGSKLILNVAEVNTQVLT